MPHATLRRRRQVPWIVAGVFLVVGCALAFGVTSVRASHDEAVLAVAKPVPAGHVVQANDLREVQMSPSSGVQPVLASGEGNIVGRPAAVALVPGTLLTPGDIGVAAGSAGSDTVAMALKAGSYPPSLGPGESVEVVPVAAASSSGSASPAPGQSAPVDTVAAVVVGIETAPTGSSAAAVVSLQVSPSYAAEVAVLGAAGNAVLIALGSGSGS